MRKHKNNRPQTFVTNEAPFAKITKSNLQTYVFNAKTSLVRNDTMEGRPFKVVPMVMMVEGVLNGSHGPLYYPADELGKTPAVWNHKPVVVTHPTINGQGVSACDPAIIDTYKIGVIMNTKFDKLGRLTAEAWIEESRANKVDPRIMVAVANQSTLELSTGLFTDDEQTPGEFEGVKYDAIARNYRPDHLAVLPDTKGACSIEDGAGFIRNELKSKVSASDTPQLSAAVLHALQRMGVKDFVKNELSFDATRRALWSALCEKVCPPKKDGTPDTCCMDLWIEDVYEDFVIYSYQTKLFKLGYDISESDSKVELDSEPSEVVRVTEYRNKDGSFVGNQKLNPNISMNKTAIINGLIANTASGWKDSDREFLNGLPDEKLALIASNAKTPTAPAAPALNVEDQEALNYGKQVLAANKKRLVDSILANKANRFTAVALNAKGLDELEALAALAAPAPAPQPGPASFFGLSPVAPVGNAQEDEMLRIPSMKFDK